MQASPSGMIKVKFAEESILEWHFIFYGLEGTPFYEGEFHGKMLFPNNFPFSPPSIQFITPNGRFKINENICFILSNFHPEQWKPGYTVSAVLQGVYSFMMCEKTETVGALPWDESEIRRCTKASVQFNKSNLEFVSLFKEDSESYTYEDRDRDKNSLLGKRKRSEEPINSTTNIESKKRPKLKDDQRNNTVEEMDSEKVGCPTLFSISLVKLPMTQAIKNFIVNNFKTAKRKVLGFNIL